MYFYKIEAVLKNYTEEKEDRSYARSIQDKPELFCIDNNKKVYVYINQIKPEKIILGAASVTSDVSDKVYAYAKFVELDIEITNIEEVTIEVTRLMLKESSNLSYVYGSDRLFSMLNIPDLSSNSSYHVQYTEYLIKDDQDYLNDNTAETFAAKRLLAEELERISIPPTTEEGTSLHPVHYIITTDTMAVADEADKILVYNLLKNKRIGCKRYLKISVPENTRPITEYDELYRINFDSTVIVDFGKKMYDGGEYADGSIQNIDSICTLAEKYRNKVLTIFNIPKGNTKIKKIVHENAGNLYFVEMSDDRLDKKNANEYLTRTAKYYNITPDENLFEYTKDETFYGPSQLNRIYQDWLGKKMNTDIYPQYSYLAKSATIASKAKPAGDAYMELSEMVGLEEAKQFICEAINYYKAQHLFADRGLRRQNTAMHMVFTGNPGTAKTTFARLMAKIMKDNKILSIGDLYEVGRADLVEKYVGWTAQNIQIKFTRAKGSVLFIDEAYSLVDSSKSFGDEAINTIVQEMENNRDDMIVILAGYPKEMEELLDKNPGLRSRIAFHLHFNDYNAEELYQITESLAKKAELTLSADVKPKLLPIFEKARRSSDFGNGRYARNLLERAQMKHANRLMSSDVEKLTDKEITTLIADDFEEIVTKQEKATIGFAG